MTNPKPKYLFLLLIAASVLTTFSLLSMYSWHLNINRPLYGFNPILDHSEIRDSDIAISETDAYIDSLNRRLSHGD